MASRTQLEVKKPLTRFADALEAWLYEKSAQTRSRWSRRKLAEALDISYGAVDNWFSKSTLPEPSAFWALVRVTGWEPAYLQELCGYPDLPPHVLGPWDFIYEEIETATLTADIKAKFSLFIQEVQRKYYHKPKRPRARRRSALVATTSPEHETTDAPVVAQRKADRKEFVGAGK